MESYNDFKARNASFNSCGYVSDEDMMKNYGIARVVEFTYNEKYGNSDEPKIGDIVEFSDGFRVYHHGKIVENLYGKSKFGMICVCERGTSFTDGEIFNTSGGAFKRFHKSQLKPAGEEENIVWTWGCNGAGAFQGIYFPLKVKKWIIPYERELKQSKVYIRGCNAKDIYGNPVSAVWIENFGEFFHAKSFKSIRAFKAWAKYVGYESKPFNGTFERVSTQKIINRCICDLKDLPKNAKPIKVMANGKIRDGWVTNDGNVISEIWLNKFEPNQHRYGTEEYKKLEEEERKLRRKYYGNPLGV